MRALFINPGGIGDQILFLPTAKLLKDKFPHCEIDLICEPRSTCIGEITNLFRKIRAFDFKDKNPNIFKLRELMRRRKYKYLISTGCSYKANFVASMGYAEIKIGFFKGILSRILLTHAVTLNPEQYVANMFAELLVPIIPELSKIIQKKEIIPEIKLNQDALDWAKETLNPRIKEKYYAKKLFIHPGVSKLSQLKNIQKKWTTKNWAILIEKLLENQDNIVILLGGEDDIETINEIHKKLSFFARPKNFFDLSALDVSIEKLGSLISASDLLVCNDSAPMHIAVGLGKKLVAYFDETDPNKLLPKDMRFAAVKRINNDSQFNEITPEIMLNTINKQLNLTTIN